MQAAESDLQFPTRVGLGTWTMGASGAARAREVAAVRHALEVGCRLIDTAEMYADGAAERIVGEALQGYGTQHREQVCIVSKVLPEHASHQGTIRACEASIRRMQCDYLDLYLLHWHGAHSFDETLRGFADLMRRGLIRHFGVSNLDLAQLEQWLDAERRLGIGAHAQCNQLFYCVDSRAIEFELLPWQRAHGVTTMAYSPLGQGSLVHHPLLERIGAQHGATAAQVALAWCLRWPDVVVIPKSVHPERIEENLRAAQLALSAADLAEIDRAFPPPNSRQPLATV